ncbi:hypothetical protein N5D61_11270 [Pseudomonas sp. GD03842]|uniref:YbaK/EbsC family protein n=1 Tax=Pseudomonas sp. GD03842 TaxID=2975385 RepID=UPI00244AF17E|nr:YbaK/EbsC family protein [Pseudomonas sp. GD03842]MDH0746924.1 hypothetical protein [Pseudomonas sp. GD03842]
MYISDLQYSSPAMFTTELQRKVYEVLEILKIPFVRVSTDAAISMSDCKLIDEKLDMQMVKTLFLTNAQKSRFYLFVTCGQKAFDSKAFSQALGCSRVSFAPTGFMKEKMGVTVGAATVFSKLLDDVDAVQVVLDKDVVSNPWYGCSDGTTTGYMKLRTLDVVETFLNHIKHVPKVITV